MRASRRRGPGHWWPRETVSDCCRWSWLDSFDRGRFCGTGEDGDTQVRSKSGVVRKDYVRLLVHGERVGTWLRADPIEHAIDVAPFLGDDGHLSVAGRHVDAVHGAIESHRVGQPSEAYRCDRQESRVSNDRRPASCEAHPIGRSAARPSPCGGPSQNDFSRRVVATAALRPATRNWLAQTQQK